jgi:hypothetical protein
MDWDKINVLLEIVHKSAGVPEANNIRNEALAALRILNEGAAPKVGRVELTAAAEPELPLVAGRRV